MTTYRCSAHGVLPSGAAWSVRIHFLSGSSVSAVETDWKTSFSAAWSTITNPLKALYPAGTILQETKTEALSVVSFVGPPAVSKLVSTAISLDNLSIAGTSSNPALPDQNCILVSLLSALPGKVNRGRIRLPAPDETLVTTGALSSTTAGHVSTAINGVLTSMVASGHTPAVVTYKQTKAGRVVGTTSTLNVAETDEVIRTVRQRAKRRKAAYV